MCGTVTVTVTSSGRFTSFWVEGWWKFFRHFSTSFLFLTMCPFSDFKFISWFSTLQNNIEDYGRSRLQSPYLTLSSAPSAGYNGTMLAVGLAVPVQEAWGYKKPALLTYTSRQIKYVYQTRADLELQGKCTMSFCAVIELVKAPDLEISFKWIWGDIMHVYASLQAVVSWSLKHAATSILTGSLEILTTVQKCKCHCWILVKNTVVQ